MYLDANDLYGHSVMQLLPFELLDWVYLDNFNLDSYFDNGSKRCFLEVDLSCPDELHDLHNDYPLLHEKMKISNGMSEYHLKVIETN